MATADTTSALTAAGFSGPEEFEQTVRRASPAWLGFARVRYETAALSLIAKAGARSDGPTLRRRAEGYRVLARRVAAELAAREG